MQLDPPPLIALVLPPSEGFTPVGTGAVGVQVRNLARASAAFRAVVLGRAQDGPTFADVPFEPVPRRLYFPLSAALRYADGVAGRIAALRPAMVEVHNRPDVARRLARRFPTVPVALFLHNDPQDMRSLRSATARARLLRAVAGVFPVSRFIRDRLLQGVTADAGRVLEHRNTVDLAALPRRRGAELLILFAGRVVADKGADLFVAACARALPELPGWRAEMIGADRFLPNGRDTSFIRHLRPLAAAAIVVVPSRWDEPFGMVALEALAAGAALICTRRGGLPEVAGEVALYLDADDPDALARLIVGLAHSPQERARRGELGRQRAAEFGLACVGADLDRHRRLLLGL